MKNQTQQGFSLIEVMVALVVAAISLAALSFALNQQAFQQIGLRERVWGQVVAINGLTDLGAGQGFVSSDLDGEQELLGVEWEWTARFEETLDDLVDKVTVTVHTKDNPQQAATQVTGYVFIPTRLNVNEEDAGNE